jgi:hypothetical protein
MKEPTKKTAWEKRRERSSVSCARELDWTYVSGLLAERFDPRLFDAWRDKWLAKAGDEWERLEILRRHAQRCWTIAEHHGRPLREISRLFEAQRRLGFSSPGDEYHHIWFYAMVLANHGKRAEGRRLLKEIAARFEVLHRDLDELRRTLAKDIRRFA